MRIQSRTKRAIKKELMTPPVQKAAVLAPTVRKSEQPQQKIEVKLPKAESQVEIKKEEVIEVPKKKRSLLEEVLEEQANLED